jgi:hypothetical protein
MKFYSHRGNLCGADGELENSPLYIDEAIENGYDVEIDLKMIGNDFFLGHDYPQYPVDQQWLEDRKGRLLIHVKDMLALRAVVDRKLDWHYFCHHNDAFTITSHGFIWVHDINTPSDQNCIVPLITAANVRSYSASPLYGVCSDYITDCWTKFKDCK